MTQRSIAPDGAPMPAGDITSTILTPSPNAQGMRQTGIAPLDELLCGGLEPFSVWLLEGAPGAGKSLAAWHFLAEGLKQGEPGLYITASEAPALVAQSFARAWPVLEAGLNQKRLAVLDPSPFFTAIRSANERRNAARADLWDEVWRFVQDAVRQARNQNARRIVIDPLTPLLLPHEHAADLWDSVQTLVTAFQTNTNATTVITHLTVHDPVYELVGATLRTLCTGALQVERRAVTPHATTVVFRALKRRHAGFAVETATATVLLDGAAFTQQVKP
jgi:KaiC/GvpD/RAD55 family RecA-like ATPase